MGLGASHKRIYICRQCKRATIYRSDNHRILFCPSRRCVNRRRSTLNESESDCVVILGKLEAVRSAAFFRLDGPI